MSENKILKIGISLRVVNASNYLEKRDALSHEWPRFFEQIEMIPILIPNNLKNPKDFLDSVGIDGIILSGGDNIGDYPERDSTEFHLIKYGIASDIPIFGVCRGMQIINNFFGGTFVKNNSNTHVGKPHQIDLVIASKFLPNQIEVNSFHNNIIHEKDLGKDLKIFAKSSFDSTIEGLIHKKYKIMGVMWHPERDPNHYNEQILKNVFTQKNIWEN